MSIETNCFHIDGLERVKVRTYRLYRIAGLRRDASDYYGNVQRIVRQLSFNMKAPVTTCDHGGRDSSWSSPTEFGDPPTDIILVRCRRLSEEYWRRDQSRFHSSPSQSLTLSDYVFSSSSFKDCSGRTSRLWQPGAGKPFFFKKPAQQFGQR